LTFLRPLGSEIAFECVFCHNPTHLCKSLTKMQDPVLLYTRARGGIYYRVTFSPTHLLAYHAKSKKQKISAAVAIVAQSKSLVPEVALSK